MKTRFPREGWTAALAAMLFLAAGGFLFFPGLKEGCWVFGTDSIGHDLVCEAYGWSRANAEGSTPWFGQRLRAGQPLLGSLAFMPFYPPNWLTGASVARSGAPWTPGQPALEESQVGGVFAGGGWNLPRTRSLQWPLHVAMGAWFLFMAVRARGGSRLAGLAAGLILGFSAHVPTLAHAGHLAKVQAIAWLPAVVWALESAARRRREPSRGSPALPMACAAAALAMQWLAGHPQIWAYSVALAVALECARPWGACAEPLNVKERCQTSEMRAFVVMGLLLLSLAMAAPMSIAVAEFAPSSNRALQTYEQAIKSSYPPEELWELALPRAAGDSVSPGLGGTGTYRGRWGERIVSDYLGLPALLLALAGALLGWRRSRLFWAGVFAATSLLCQGGYLGGIHRLLYDWLPGFRMFRSPATMMVLLPLSAGMLAADGLDALRGSGPLPKRRAWAFAMLGGLLVAATLSPLPRWTLETALGEAFRPEQAKAHIASKRHAAVVGLLAAGLAAGWLASRRRKEFSPKGALALSLAVLALIAGDLFATTRFFVRPAPCGAFEGAIRAHRGLERLQTDWIARRGGGEPALPPGLFHEGRELSLWPMLAGWRVPHGYHPVAPAALESLMRDLGHDSRRFLDEANVRAAIRPDGRVDWRDPPEYFEASAIGGAPPSSDEAAFLLEGPGPWKIPLRREGWRVAEGPAGLSLEAHGLGTLIRAETPLAKPARVVLEFMPASRRWGPSVLALAWILAFGGAAAMEARARR